mgnify:CR=1 FL=1
MTTEQAPEDTPENKIKALEEEIKYLQHYKKTIRKMCSRRLTDVDDYIRMAKDAEDKYFWKRDIK